MRYVSVAEMKEIDRSAIEDSGIAALTLMENAGKALAGEARKIMPKDGANILVVCGYGNNGGDGLVAARHLMQKGCSVKIIFAGKPKSFTPEANANLEPIFKSNIQPKFVSTIKEFDDIFNGTSNDLIIDAIFGIGIRGPLDDFYVNLIDKINNSGVLVISADVPSGLDADTGKPLPVAVKAHTTVTFGYPKVGFKYPEAGEYVGHIVVADIGLPKTVSGEKNSEEGKTKEPVIRLRAGKKGAVRDGHPWIFRQRLAKAASNIKPGAIVALQDAEGKFLGRGYYNPKSDISIRLLTFKDEAIDKKLFENRIKDALTKRGQIKSITNAYRAVFSEADGLPGLIVDIYDDTAVFQVMTLGMDKLKSFALEAIREIIKPAYVYERSESSFRKLEGLKDVKKWWGETGRTVIEIFEGKAKFLVDIINGHKTGFYLDQRRARLGLEGFCKDKTVLDLFCYTGGFTISSAIFGAREAEGVDVKDEWLKLAGQNAGLNSFSGKVKFVKGDAFAVLKSIFQSGRKFDIIIVDPPSFLKTKQSLASASKGYEELNTLAMKTLTSGGMLATFSCSHNMPNKLFSDILKNSAAKAGKMITILKRCHQDIDHPIVRAIPETEYLKGYFLKVSDQGPAASDR